jgi:NADH dehydrogenase [ubiquinone] 1 alpha subcomplex assembly factor 1
MPAFLLASLFLLSTLVPTAGAAGLPEPPMRPLMQFDGSPTEPRWVAVNDGVMGGLSQGGPEVRDGHLRFRGALSLANNGGFSSVRTVGQAFDLSGATAVVLRVRGDGRPYQLRLATSARFRGIAVSYGGEFTTQAGQWTEVRVPLDVLVPTVRGFRLDGPPFDPADVREIGLLIADKREGAFALDVDWMALE